MPDLQEAAVVTEGIREQAEKLGYIVKQKGTLENYLGSPQWHEIISHFDPWHVISNSDSVFSSRPFRSRPFNTEEEALALLPEILRNDARMRALDYVWISPWVDSYNEFGLGCNKFSVPAGPYDSVGAALDVAEQAVKEYVEKKERERLSRLALRLEAHQRNMPSAFHGRNLENFNAKSETLEEALEVARQYVTIFPNHNSKCLVLCGARGTGKTSLAVATAASLTVHDRVRERTTEHDLQCHYKTVSSALIADDAELCAPGVLLLDWCELQEPVDSHDPANVNYALAGRAVANMLALRYEANLATVLIADCDHASLIQYLGLAAARKLLEKSWEIVQLEKAKEVTNVVPVNQYSQDAV
jgi:hypothetical protein